MSTEQILSLSRKHGEELMRQLGKHKVNWPSFLRLLPDPDPADEPRTDYIGAPLEAMRPESQRTIAIPKVDQ